MTSAKLVVTPLPTNPTLTLHYGSTLIDPIEHRAIIRST